MGQITIFECCCNSRKKNSKKYSYVVKKCVQYFHFFYTISYILSTLLFSLSSQYLLLLCFYFFSCFSCILVSIFLYILCLSRVVFYFCRRFVNKKYNLLNTLFSLKNIQNIILLLCNLYKIIYMCLLSYQK